jgi:hypothetical protein
MMAVPLTEEQEGCACANVDYDGQLPSPKTEVGLHAGQWIIQKASYRDRAGDAKAVAKLRTSGRSSRRDRSISIYIYKYSPLATIHGVDVLSR